MAVTLFLPGTAFSAVPAHDWDQPSRVTPNTLFFEETPRKDKPVSDKPEPGDKAYAWYCLEKGNDHFLSREYDQAASYFRAAYETAGPERVLSGFKLVNAYEAGGRVSRGRRYDGGRH